MNISSHKNTTWILLAMCVSHYIRLVEIKMIMRILKINFATMSHWIENIHRRRYTFSLSGQDFATYFSWLVSTTVQCITHFCRNFIKLFIYFSLYRATSISLEGKEKVQDASCKYTMRIRRNGHSNVINRKTISFPHKSVRIDPSHVYPSYILYLHRNWWKIWDIPIK